MTPLQIVTGPTTNLPLWWLIRVYGVISLGELMLSPWDWRWSRGGPHRMRGLMMGGWFAATAIGNKLTGIGRLLGSLEPRAVLHLPGRPGVRDGGGLCSCFSVR
jgi:dipeptide/tripeptide permease